MSRPFRPLPPAVAAALTVLLASACATGGTGVVGGPDAGGPGGGAAGGNESGALRPLFADAGTFAALPAAPRANASSPFWAWWGDGRAEMAGYRVTTERYGELRDGELVLVYVTEPHDRRTWVKDDAVAAPHRVEVLKLITSLKFQTGIYPYSVLTSVFAPVDDWGGERFAPVKVSTSVQEWCGSTQRMVWPGARSMRSLLLSYFADEGERIATVPVPQGALYEDALPLQLRELDGPFAGGGDWEGWLVPSLWDARRAHQEPAPRRARIVRTMEARAGVAATRFDLHEGERTRSFWVERDGARRVLAWEGSDGERAELIRSERLPYWTLNALGDESYRARLGLPPAPAAAGGGSRR